MSEIPQDVMIVAKNALFMCGAVHFPAWGQPANGKALIESEAIEATAKAILAERKACAKIAEDFLEPVDVSDKDMMGVKRRHQPWFNDIAAAIRRR